MRKYREEKACNRCQGQCMGCFYSDECPAWNTNWVDTHVTMLPVEEVFMSLCEGRHEIPEAIDGSIFGNTLNPTDIAGMETEAKKQLGCICKLNLYVTGLTVALVAVLNVCREKHIAVTLYHFDRETGSYYPQEVK